MFWLGGGQVRVLEGHSEPVTSVAISAKGDKIVSGSWDKIVRVWSVETGQVPARSAVECPEIGVYVRSAIIFLCFWLVDWFLCVLVGG